MLASGAKATVGENIANAGGAIDATACNGVATFTTATKNTESLACEDGVITVTGTEAAKGVALTFTPEVADAGITWKCESTADNKYLPAECRK